MPQLIPSLLFYAFASILLLAAFRVITTRNPVHAVMYMVLTFFQAAAIWLLMQAEFLAVVLLLVYVGAVLVLFLFVLMMIRFDVQTARVGFWKHFPIAAVVGLLFVVELVAVFIVNYQQLKEAPPMRAADGAVLADDIGNVNALGTLLYSEYLYPVEIAAVLLLVAIIAAIALTLRQRKGSHRQAPSWQVGVHPQDRVRVVKLAPTLPAKSDADNAKADTNSEAST